MIYRITLAGEPLPKERPRVVRQHGKTRTFTPTRTLKAEEALTWAMRQVVRRCLKEPLCLYVNFYRATKRRVDLDNLVKLVLDAGNRVIWSDDSLVQSLSANLFYADPDPRTEIVLIPFEGGRDTDALRPGPSPAAPLPPLAAAPEASLAGRAGRGRASGTPR